MNLKPLPLIILGYIVDIVVTLIAIVAVAFLVRYFLIQPFVVDGNSMEPNYHSNQYILINKITYQIHSPGHDDVIVFRYPKNTSVFFIKRIIGLPGDDVKISGGHVYINSQLQSESYLPSGVQTLIDDSPDKTFEQVIPQNQYFVLGDNRTESSDSREWGMLPKSDIVGKYWVTIYTPASTQTTPQSYLQNNLANYRPLDRFLLKYKKAAIFA